MLERLLGREPSHARRYIRRPDAYVRPSAGDANMLHGELSFGQALDRYRYLRRTTPPEALEDLHADAFARLSPDQRVRVLRELTRALPPFERAPDFASADDPRALARMATRAESRCPGVLERMLGRSAGEIAAPLGSDLASSFLAGALGGLVAAQLFTRAGHDLLSGAEEEAISEGAADQGIGARETDVFADDFFAEDFLESDLGDFDD